MYYKEQSIHKTSKLPGFKIAEEPDEDRRRRVNDFRVGKIIGKGIYFSNNYLIIYRFLCFSENSKR